MTIKDLVRRLKEFFILPSGATQVNNGAWYGGRRSPIKYASAVGDGLDSSVLMSPVKWIQRNFPQAFLEVVDIRGKPEPKPVLNHPMVALVERPNDFYSSAALWAGTIFSYITDGNGYWLKVRRPVGSTPWYENVTGEVQYLWYAPHWLTEPMYPSATSDVFISHYEYRPGGSPIEVAKENVVHFRNGIDPRNPRKGMSQIVSELREIFTDDEAANFAATLLNNMGVPGIVVSPDGPGETIPTGDLEEYKAILISKTTGDRRGEPFVSNRPVKVQPYGFNPKQMDFGSIRDIAEERLCSALGIPAAVVGFGTGLQQTKVGATMREMKRMAWEDCLIPMQGNFSDQLGVSLLNDFEGQPENFQARFNHSEVPAMQDNVRDKARWVGDLVQAGLLRVDIAQSMMGVQVDETQKVYLRPATMVAVPAETAIVPPVPPVAPKHRSKKKPTPAAAFLALEGPLEAEAQSKIADRFASEGQALAAQLSAHFPKRRKDDDWIAPFMEEQRDAWITLLEEEVILQGIEGGNELLRGEIEAGVSFDLVNDRAVTYAAQRAGLSVSEISATTIADIQRVIGNAIENGWTLKQTSAALADLYEGFSTSRALTIARTETASAMNWGRHESAVATADELDMQLQQTWVAVSDSRTRPSHAAANGQTVKLKEKFTVGGVSMKYPGDSSAPAEEIVMCRCTTVISEVEG